jgi:hypothetical protein
MSVDDELCVKYADGSSISPSTILSRFLRSSTNCGRSSGFSIVSVVVGFLIRLKFFEAIVVGEQIWQGPGYVALYILIGRKVQV